MTWKDDLLGAIFIPFGVIIYFFEICIFALTIETYPTILDTLPIWSALVMYFAFLIPPILICKVFKKILVK
jgi:hypothetical protein